MTTASSSESFRLEAANSRTSDLTSDEIEGGDEWIDVPEKCNENSDPLKKYDHLFTKSVKQQVETVYVTNYGSVRFDQDNLPATDENISDKQCSSDGANIYVGQSVKVLDEKSSAMKTKETSGNEPKLNYFDEMYFEDALTASNNMENSVKYSSITTHNTNSGNNSYKTEGTRNVDSQVTQQNTNNAASHQLNYIDDQYFNHPLNKIGHNPENRCLSVEKCTEAMEDLNLIDAQYFSKDSFVEKIPTVDMPLPKQKDSTLQSLVAPDRMRDTSDQNNRHKQQTADAKAVVNSADLHHKDPVEKEVVYSKRITDSEVKKLTKPRPNLEDPQTAFDYVMKLRKDEKTKTESSTPSVEDTKTGTPLHLQGSVDSKGFRTMKNAVTDLDNMTHEEVLKQLKESVLFDQYDILALDKPYGLAIHDSTKYCRHKLTAFLPELAKMYKASELFTVHRLDKETTGVILLAKTQLMADTLETMLKKQQIKKMYWAITKGVPEPTQGTVDIPIAEGEVENKTRMVLKPDYSVLGLPGFKSSKVKSHRAITHYKVLASRFNASLIELRPETGVKHQLRVHLGLGLSCPVLGDHKYSHWDKIVPQKLPSDMLQKLGIRQSKVRTIPMHLHAKQVVIPDLTDGKYACIRARLPRFFMKTIDRFKFSSHKKE